MHTSLGLDDTCPASPSIPPVRQLRVCHAFIHAFLRFVTPYNLSAGFAAWCSQGQQLSASWQMAQSW